MRRTRLTACRHRQNGPLWASGQGRQGLLLLPGLLCDRRTLNVIPLKFKIQMA
jgi:hypothetical protein